MTAGAPENRREMGLAPPQQKGDEAAAQPETPSPEARGAQAATPVHTTSGPTQSGQRANSLSHVKDTKGLAPRYQAPLPQQGSMLPEANDNGRQEEHESRQRTTCPSTFAPSVSVSTPASPACTPPSPTFSDSTPSTASSTHPAATPTQPSTLPSLAAHTLPKESTRSPLGADRDKAFALEIALGNGRPPEWRVVMVQSTWNLSQLAEHACVIWGLDIGDKEVGKTTMAASSSNNSVHVESPRASPHRPQSLAARMFSFRLRLDEVLSIRQLEHGDKILLCPNGAEPVPYAVLACGNNRRGQLGLGSAKQFAAKARVIPPLCGLQVVQVACGASHTLLLTREGQVLSFGKGSNGRLGYVLDATAESASQLAPRRVELPTFARAGFVACGESSSAVLASHRTDSARLNKLIFTFGAQGPWLGLGAKCKEDLEDVSSPTQVELDLESEESLVQVSCGKEHMVCCSSNGACWTWGADSEDGKLGHVMASASGEPYFITLQELSDNVFPDQRTAFAGLRMARQAARDAIDHSSLCDTQMETSKLMMRVLDAGQRLPFAKYGVSYLLDDCVTGIIDAQTGESLERSRAEGLEIEEGEEGEKEERVTSECDTQEILFVRANQEACWAPRRVMLLRGHIITRVAAGMRHSLFLTSNGNVLASGNNQHGQLGLGTELVTGTSGATIFVPTKVPLKAAAKDIAAGASHSVALGKNQHVYTWGHGDLIGRPDGDPYRPEEICFEGGPLGLVRHIAVGDAHTVVSTAFGHCIGFGRNPCCQLGMSSPNELIDIPTLIDTSLGSEPKSLQKKAAAGGDDDGVPDFASLNPQNDDNLIIMGIAAGGGLAQDTGHTLFLSSSLQLADPGSVDFASTSAFSQPWSGSASNYTLKIASNKINRNFCVGWRQSSASNGNGDNNVSESTCSLQ